jgi:hypothetical protein
VSSGERKGKASPLEAGRGKNSLPANPERVTLKVLQRKEVNDEIIHRRCKGNIYGTLSGNYHFMNNLMRKERRR